MEQGPCLIPSSLQYLTLFLLLSVSVLIPNYPTNKIHKKLDYSEFYATQTFYMKESALLSKLHVTIRWKAYQVHFLSQLGEDYYSYYAVLHSTLWRKQPSVP